MTITGIQVHTPSRQIRALYHDEIIAGISFDEAKRSDEGVVGWFKRVITHFWGSIVAMEVVSAEIVTVAEPQLSPMSNEAGLMASPAANDASSSPTLSVKM